MLMTKAFMFCIRDLLRHCRHFIQSEKKNVLYMQSRYLTSMSSQMTIRRMKKRHHNFVD